MSEQDKPQQAHDEAEVNEQAPRQEPELIDEGAEAQDDELVQARERLSKLEKALAEADLRAQAEMQNVRRRAERDVESAHKFALEKFAGDLLPVADSLERGLSTLDADDPSLKPAREGLELTLKVLLDVFARYNLEQIDPQGQPFNPEHHEAMTMVPAPDAEPNSVIEVLEKGYLLNGRLIRPARVVVSKAG
ncbi:nucleotide exchange factor GrpE [Alcanivorax marinus]|uniref:Protein GrpE n=1 Tax=Alloalcanivorax marinus TaxID=1177169 RepID=A0A9Q3UMR9_9GAMM|nr:nucleotide exchange factor GrpE [Alloalcanivorax marinus]MCC4310161.1 nucleotide exchange factor GrpE [Alloalcanivorax marinus]MCU5788080.1 heat shock protein GrpE [Alloalcanivorax marinus]